MPRATPGHLVAPGIYQHASGYRVVVTARRQKREATFPLSTPVAKLAQWQLRTKATLLEDAPLTPARGTLAADVPRYLATITDPASRAYQSAQLQPWVTALGSRRRDTITSVDIRTALAGWLQEKSARGRPYAAGTLNHRLSALRALYRTLDADSPTAVNPVTRVAKLRERQPEPREIPREVIDLIVAAIRDHRHAHVLTSEQARAIYAAGQARPRPNRSALARQYGCSEAMIRKIQRSDGDLSAWDAPAFTRARLMVVIETGLPQKQVMGIRREHLSVAPPTRRQTPAIAGRLWVTPRRKGRGTEGVWLPLTPAGVDAIQHLLDIGAAGPFDTTAMARTFKAAVAAVLRDAREAGRILPPLPTGLRPYDLRHSFLTRLYRASKDRQATQRLGLHADPRTTDRYILGAAEDGADQAILAISLRPSSTPRA